MWWGSWAFWLYAISMQKQCFQNLTKLLQTCSFHWLYIYHEIFLFLGVSTLENRTICLTVIGEDPEEELVIYMTLNNIIYPLGLLPGHVIRLCNLERKVSRQGSVYCQYVVISTVQVLEVQVQLPPTIRYGNYMWCWYIAPADEYLTPVDDKLWLQMLIYYPCWWYVGLPMLIHYPY